MEKKKPDFVVRLENELKTESEKLEKLCAFTHTETYEKLDDENRFLLTMQIDIMQSFCHVLARRLEVIKY